jgi:hypothetical protein
MAFAFCCSRAGSTPSRRSLKGRSIFGLYPATEEKTKTDFAAWRKTKGR